mmetsp:Transcript_19701/g.62016  ORF Transcript_19701/g.62016 Transcript_19701/m.62016 type:complete len:101 (+) Transcript_19701:342-644(+)
MDLIRTSPGESVDLTLGRGVSRVCIQWPNRVRTAAKPGDSMRVLAAEALVPVKYSCDSGGCGTCEHKIVDGDGEGRYTRICVARVPKAPPQITIVPSDRV